MVLLLPSISHTLVSYVTVEPVKKKIASKQNQGRITFVSVPGRKGATVVQRFLARHIGFKWLQAILLLNMVTDDLWEIWQASILDHPNT